MYPTIEIFSIKIYTFGFLLACTWLLFFIFLHRFSIQRGIMRPVFANIIPFTLSIFLFSRVFHILSDWLNEKFILMELIEGNFLEFTKLFFIPQNFFFSLFWAVVGFLVIFIIKTHDRKKDRARYMDAIVLAFLAASLLWYFWALLGGQVYGIPFDSFLSIKYNHIDSIVKDRAALFPLAFFYIVLISAILMGLWKFTRKKTLPDGLIGFIGIGAFCIVIFLGEFLSGSRKDIFYDFFALSLNQAWALIWLIFVILWVLRIIGKKI